MLKKFIVSMALLMTLSVFGYSMNVGADAAPGDRIVVLGEDLTKSQKNDILKEMGIDNPDDVQITTVSNADEHKYLGDYIPAAQIGQNAISSAIIVIGEKNDGLSIQLNNIDYITEQMYGNALSTAGVKDAKIYITAPFQVSGTGALTGIMQAYEVTSGEKITEDKKDAATEEMVITSELSENETMNEEEAANFITIIKQKISEKKPESKEEIKILIEEVANEKNYDLTKEEITKLVDLFQKFKDLNIDWDAVNQKVDETKGKVTDFLESEEGKSFLEKIKDFFKSLWNMIFGENKSE
ncbi:MAG TPA: DUF1002 domain-containing protein [Pseudogracilibacillus sp.]|nr:DUF1002 domain-containing protein [Pseudogracilibacillus sp.]